jgi:hypothetical protein
VLANGQWDTYAVTASNPNAVGLDAFTVHEDLPVALTMVHDGAPNVHGPGVAPQVSWRPLGGGAFQAAATTPMGGTWTATLPASADEIRLDYGPVPAGFQASAQLRAGLPLSGIGLDGAPIVAGSTVSNCVTTTGVAGNGAGLFRSACTDQQAEAVAVSFAKERTSAASASSSSLIRARCSTWSRRCPRFSTVWLGTAHSPNPAPERAREVEGLPRSTQGGAGPPERRSRRSNPRA